MMLNIMKRFRLEEEGIGPTIYSAMASTKDARISIWTKRENVETVKVVLAREGYGRQRPVGIQGARAWVGGREWRSGQVNRGRGADATAGAVVRRLYRTVFSFSRRSCAAFTPS